MADTIIWGCINSNGTIYKGSGFDSRLNEGDTGFYTITYGPPPNPSPFKDVPAVVVTQNYMNWNDFDYKSGDTKDNAVLVASDATHFQVKTGNGSGDAANRNFTFIAIGPGFN